MIKSKLFELPSFQLSQLHSASPHVQLFRSPYDVPESVRATYDSDLHRMEFAFQYIASEPKTTTFELQPDLQLTIGANSGKVYRIVAELKSPQDVSYLGQKVGDCLKQLQAGMPTNRENYNVVAQVLQDKTDEILPMAVGA
jgi:hypothetical protein